MLRPRPGPSVSAGEVDSGRGAGLSTGPFPRAASRTRRAPRRRSGLSTSPVTGYVNHSYDATVFVVCDAENDGHAVWAGYYDNSSNSYKSANVIYTNDTSGIDCTQYDIYPRQLTNLRAVEDNPNSSTNYYGAWHGYPVAGN